MTGENRTQEGTSIGSAVGEVVDHTLEEAKDVAQREVGASRRALEADAREVMPSGLVLGAAALFGGAGLLALLSGLMGRWMRQPRRALEWGVGLLGVGAGLGVAGRFLLPPRPFGRVRDRVSQDFKPLAS